MPNAKAMCSPSMTGLPLGGNSENQSMMFSAKPPQPAIRMAMPRVSAMPRPPRANIHPKSSTPAGRFCEMKASGPWVLAMNGAVGEWVNPDEIHPRLGSYEKCHPYDVTCPAALVTELA